MTYSATIPQYHRLRFLRLVDEYARASKTLDTTEGRRAFVLLSVQVHIAKGDVPKRMWPLVNRALRAP